MTNSDNVERHNLPHLNEKLSVADSPSKVGIKISEKTAKTREGQLILWMACNLCVRLTDLISELELVIPENVVLSKSPFIPFSEESDTDLKATIIKYAKLCSKKIKIISTNNSDFKESNSAVILIGYDAKTDKKIQFGTKVFSCGWLAFVGKPNWYPSVSIVDTNNPFGPFVSACIAVGDVFKFLRKIKDEHGQYANNLCFSVYDFTSHEIRNDENLKLSNPSLPNSVDVGNVHLVGAGAVGQAVCHILYAINGIKGNLVIIDRKQNESNGEEVIDGSNLNRYSMTRVSDTAKPKATHLVAMMNKLNPNISSSAFDDSFETYVNENSGIKLHNVLSCVDTNEARHSIQDQLPRTILGGSTYEMTVKTALYDMAKQTQCLKCYNELKARKSDVEIIENLKKLDNNSLTELARKNKIEPEKLKQFLDDPRCGELGFESIQKFASNTSVPEWSVGFVSAMSGFLLASEFVKSKLSNDNLKPAINCEPHTNYVFNFWYNNGRFEITKPNPHCWCNNGISYTPRTVFNSSWSC